MYSKLVNFARVKVKKGGFGWLFLCKNVVMVQKYDFRHKFVRNMSCFQELDVLSGALDFSNF